MQMISDISMKYNQLKFTGVKNMNIVIVNKDGWFLEKGLNECLIWSKEYPNAIIFQSIEEVKKFKEYFRSAFLFFKGHMVQDYGLETEKIISI
jgi:hypothetical protein